MSVKAKIEAVIYATEEPVTIGQLASLLKDPVLAELATEEAALKASPESPTDDAKLTSEGQTADLQGPAAVEHTKPAKYFDGGMLAPGDFNHEQQAQRERDDSKRIKAYLTRILDELVTEYAQGTHGVEIRQLAGGYRMGTKPEHHDIVIGFAKSLKPPVRLSLQALETLAVIAYKQPVTVPEISEIRGVDTSGVIATLLDRKLITTAGRKQVIGRPILYKTTKEFLLRFGLNSVSELPSIEEFEKLGDPQGGLFSLAKHSAATSPGKPPDGADPTMNESEKSTPASENEPATSPNDHS
jgi:segregation and condensation protein B